MLDTGHGRKTDAHDAHSVAVAAVRAKEPRVMALDPPERGPTSACPVNAARPTGGGMTHLDESTEIR
jgi:hypothetical protein